MAKKIIEKKIIQIALGDSAGLIALTNDGKLYQLNPSINNGKWQQLLAITEIVEE